MPDSEGNLIPNLALSYTSGGPGGFSAAGDTFDGSRNGAATRIVQANNPSYQRPPGWRLHAASPWSRPGETGLACVESDIRLDLYG